jgi:hypothetical protein
VIHLALFGWFGEFRVVSQSAHLAIASCLCALILPRLALLDVSCAPVMHVNRAVDVCHSSCFTDGVR